MKARLMWELCERIDCYLSFACIALRISVGASEWDFGYIEGDQCLFFIPAGNRWQFNFSTFGLGEDKPIWFVNKASGERVVLVEFAFVCVCAPAPLKRDRHTELYCFFAAFDCASKV